jgi:hypothetical protein
VWTNGVQASCNSDPVALGSACLFSYSSTIVPTVTALSQSVVTAGDVLVITGTQFAPSTSGNVVTLGAATCNVTAASSTSITCVVPVAAAGEFPLVVTVLEGSRGYAALATDIPLIQYALSVTDVDTQQGSLCGGTRVTFSGVGFFPSTDSNQVCVWCYG